MPPPAAGTATAPALAAPAGLLAALAVVALNQRPALAAVPPLAGDIAADTGLRSAGIGLLTTVPILAMGLGAPLASRVADRLGRERALLAGLALVALGCSVRLVNPGTATLFAGAVLAGAGITTIGTLVPAVISELMPQRAGLATGVTTFALSLGAVAAALLVEPLAAALGGWPAALAFWALPALVGLVVWWPVARRHRIPAQAAQRTPLPWRSTTAWLAAGLMALESAHFFVALAWVTPTYAALGLPATRSAGLLGLVTAGNLVGALAAPWLAGRAGHLRAILLGAVLLAAAMTTLLALAPLAAPEPAMLLLGAGLGAGFGVALLLLVDLADGPASSGALSAMVFLVAYLLAAPVPALFGALRDGATDPAAWSAILAMSLLQLPVVLALGPSRRASVSVRPASAQPTT